MARSWWNWAADARLQVAPLAIVVGLLAGCGDRGPEDPAACPIAKPINPPAINPPATNPPATDPNGAADQPAAPAQS